MGRIFLNHNLLLPLLVLFAFGLLLPQESKAQRGGGAPGRFSAGAMLLFGQGKMGNGDDVPDRAMVHTPLAVFAGINIKKFRIGANYEYNMIGQSEDPAGLNNQNLSGSGSAMGLRLEFYDGKQSAGLVYRLSNTYSLEKPTQSGASSQYKAAGGFSLQYYRQIKKRFGIVLDYTTETFKESVPEPSAAVKFDRMAIGLVFTNFAGAK